MAQVRNKRSPAAVATTVVAIAAMAQGSEKAASGAPPRRQSNRTTRSIQKSALLKLMWPWWRSRADGCAETTRRAAPAKVRSKKRRVEKVLYPCACTVGLLVRACWSAADRSLQKLAGTHTRDLESILADKVLSKNERLKVLKPDPKVVEREKLREQKKRKKRG